jgi:hypothetical protein
MRKLNGCQCFKGVVATGRRLFDPGVRGNSAAIWPLVFCGFLVLHLGSPNPLTPTTAIAANGEARMSDEARDHSAEIAPPFPANESTISIDNSVYTSQNASQSWSLSSPDADTLRFELHSGDHWSSSSWTDPATAERDEISGQTVYPPGTQINIAYDFMVEPGQTNSASGPGRFLVLGQMHEHNVPKSPPFAVELVNGDHMAIDIGTGNPVYLYKDPSPIVRGHYYSMNIQAKFAKDGDGFLEVWRDGANIVDYHGSIGTGAGTYWKQGIYRSSAKESIAVNFRRLKITAIAMVTGISASLVNRANGGGATIAVTLHMSEAVTVSGTPQLMLSDGSTAIYTGGSVNNALIFSFTAGADETNVSVPEVAGVNLPHGATVKDALGAAANLSIASIARSGLRFDKRATGNESRHVDP